MLFAGPCYFTDRKFFADISFNNAVFNDLVEFHGCTFCQGMSFLDTEFNKTRGKDKDEGEALERSYRTLKLGMEGLRARNEEAKFFALEMECRRQRWDLPRSERFAAITYKYLSNYGQSLVWPLVWFTGLNGLFFLFYAVLFYRGASIPGYPYFYLTEIWEFFFEHSLMMLTFTVEQIFRPFFVWAAPSTSNAYALVQQNTFLIPFLASLQSLGTIGLLTLFLLALRRRFKMD